MPVTSRSICRPFRGRRGAAAAELALVLPVLVLLLVIIVDFARLFYHYVTITNCARAGALYASDPVAAADSGYTSVEQAALADAPNLSPQPTVAAPVYGTDANGDPYVEVTVTHQFQMLTSYLGFGTVDLSRTVRMRRVPEYPNGPV